MTITSASPTQGLVWQPGPTEIGRSRILKFAAAADCATISELGAKAYEKPSWFWGTVSEWLELDWQETPTATLDQLDEPHATKWFVNGKFNAADNAVHRWVRAGRGNETALAWEVENGESGKWTFDELAAEVDRVSRGLLNSGVKFGDTVGIQLPMVKEAAVAQLACAKIGAISVPIFSGFGATAVADRLRIAGAKAHIVANGFDRRGRVVALRPEAAVALKGVESLHTTVVVALVPGNIDPALPGEVAWEALGAEAPAAPLEAATCPADHPLLIAFTSGTTGAPKGIVLSHAGFAVKAASDVAFSFDVGRGDVAMWVTDPGWIMSPITVLGGLIAGSSVALYSGSPDFPSAGRIWDVVRNLNVTMLGVSPTLIRSLMTQDSDAADIDLGSLRVLASSGEAWTPDAYEWLFERVAQGQLPVINYSGGTEVSGAILTNFTAQPIHPCGFAGPLPGMGADVVDADGNSVGTGIGELALRRPSPGMPITFWGAPERYYSTYWNRWAATWFHGDWVEVNNEKVWFVRGRSDDTLKIAGKRLGPAEVESVVNSVPSVVESAAISIPDPIKGEALVIFARVAPGTENTRELAQIISDVVSRDLGKPLKPKLVHVVDTLPRTRSGKILRRVIRSVYLGETPGDTSSLEDPASLSAIGGGR